MTPNPSIRSAVAASPQWIRSAARLGYAARGLIYLVIGAFAAAAAYGAGRTMGSREAVSMLGQTPLGALLVWILVAGLVCYAGWRFVQAAFDPDGHGLGPQGLVIRIALAAGGLTYLALALFAASAWSGGGGGGGLAERLSGFVGTRWAATIICIVLLGAAAAHIFKAVRERYARYFEADDRTMRIIHPIAKIGLLARGLIFALAAFMLALSAWRGEGRDDPPGSKEVLDFIQSMPGGGWLLAATGFGLVLFAAYSFAEARYRKIAF